MALNKTTLKDAIAAALNGHWNGPAKDALLTEVRAAYTTAFAVTDPAAAASARNACADAIGTAVDKYVHGVDAVRITALALAISDAIDTFVKGATITISAGDVGLQTTTGAGTPTGGPAAPVAINGAVS